MLQVDIKRVPELVPEESPHNRGRRMRFRWKPTR
jgi:hypothetical protein